MKKGILLSILWLSSFVIYSRAQELALDSSRQLSYFIEAAIAHNKLLKSQRLELEKQGLIKKQIYHTYLPKLEASGTYAYSKGKLNIDTDPVPFTFPGLTLPITGMPPMTIPPMDMAIPGLDHSMDYSGNLWMGGLTAKWTIFTGLKVPYLGKAMQHKIRAEEYMLDQSEADIIEEVSFYYDNIALLAQSSKLLQESEKRLDRESKVAKHALQEGLITQHDFQKIEIAILELASKQIEYDGKRSLLHLKLKQMTDLSLEEIALVKIDLHPIKSFNHVGTYLNRPELKALDEAIIANEYKAKSELSGYLPKAQVFATHQYAGFTNGEVGPVGFNKINAYPINAVGVGLKWELFDGLHTHSERKKAKIEILQTQNKRDEAAELLMLNYNNCYSNFQVNTAKEALKIKQQESSLKSLQISYKEYQNGLINISELLEALTDYEKIVLDYYQTVFDQRQSAVKLMNATGDLNALSIQK